MVLPLGHGVRRLFSRDCTEMARARPLHKSDHECLDRASERQRLLAWVDRGFRRTHGGTTTSAAAAYAKTVLISCGGFTGGLFYYAYSRNGGLRRLLLNTQTFRRVEHVVSTTSANRHLKPRNFQNMRTLKGGLQDIHPLNMRTGFYATSGACCLGPPSTCLKVEL